MTLAGPSLSISASANARRAVAGASFSPPSLSAVTAWLRNTINDADIDSVTDQFGGSPATQSVAARRLTGNADFSMQGIETIDNLTWPLGSGNNGVNQTGFACWMAPDSVAVAGNLICIALGVGGASARKLIWSHNTSRIRFQVFDPNAPGNNGRDGQTATGVISTSPQFVTFEFDGTYPTEAERFIVTVNTVPINVTFTNIGTPSGPITSLPVVTGNIIIANFQNTTVGSNPLKGRMGRNIYAFGSRMAGATTGLLTSAARTALMNFEPLV